MKWLGQPPGGGGHGSHHLRQGLLTSRGGPEDGAAQTPQARTGPPQSPSSPLSPASERWWGAPGGREASRRWQGARQEEKGVAWQSHFDAEARLPTHLSCLLHIPEQRCFPHRPAREGLSPSLLEKIISGPERLGNPKTHTFWKHWFCAQHFVSFAPIISG